MPKPKVTLVTHTKDPLETVYVVWQASKNEERLLSVEDVRAQVDPEEVRKLFRAVIDQRIPIGEHVDFVFMIENISVSWREQAVRHRIGVSPSPERLGADIGMVDVQEIPNLSDSSWWSQSMRIQDMGRFADKHQYRMPQSVKDHPDQTLRMKFQETMEMVQEFYNELVKAGVPMEDARELIPLGATHRISWRLNIGALQHIVSKRGCWILQLGIWGPVIEGMISELVQKVDPIFGELVTPPCLKGDEFTGCVYMEENRRRYTQDDCHAPCPLHVIHHHLPSRGIEVESTRDNLNFRRYDVLDSHGVPRADELVKRADQYRSFWGRDPYNGRRLRVLP